MTNTKIHLFSGKRAIVFGANGGLGSEIAMELDRQGVQVALAGRNKQKLVEVQTRLQNPSELMSVDITSYQSLERSFMQSGNFDFAINATGFDVRKQLQEQSQTEIQSSIALNFLGPINITKICLQQFQKSGCGILLHIGGFGDGRLAFPCYSVDAAARAGVYTFIESVNREVANPSIKILYFCPSPADTKSEQPYHSLWREMGVKIDTPQKVASEVIKSIYQKRERYFMGGLVTLVGIKINLLWKGLADLMFMNSYSKKINAFFTINKVQP